MIAVPVAPTLDAAFAKKWGLDNQHIDGGGGCSLPNIARCLNAGGTGRLDFETETLIPIGGFFSQPTHSLRAGGHDASEVGTGRGTPIIPVAFGPQNSHHQGDSASYEVFPSLDKSKIPGVHQVFGVRRIMPIEAERLQGFPDGYTAITYRGKPAADAPRYEALGNSMAVPVMRWIGERIAKVDSPDLQITKGERR